MPIEFCYRTAHSFLFLRTGSGPLSGERSSRRRPDHSLFPLVFTRPKLSIGKVASGVENHPLPLHTLHSLRRPVFRRFAGASHSGTFPEPPHLAQGSINTPPRAARLAGSSKQA